MAKLIKVMLQNEDGLVAAVLTLSEARELSDNLLKTLEQYDKENDDADAALFELAWFVASWGRVPPAASRDVARYWFDAGLSAARE